MNLSEKEIEEFIYNDLLNNSGKELMKRGLVLQYYDMLYNYDHFNYTPKIKWFRQLNVSPYGIIDIVGFYRHRGTIYVELIELKARPIQAQDFDQILRYECGLFKALNNTFLKNNCFHVRNNLIGTGYSDGHYIQNNLDCLVAVISYDLNGIAFKTHSELQWTKGEISFRKDGVVNAVLPSEVQLNISKN